MGSWTLVCVTVLFYNVTGVVCAGLHNSIVGGNDAKKGAWPWMVYLETHIDSKNYSMCGGSLLSNQWVMTAAHCWQDAFQLGLSFARVGELSLKESSGKQVKLQQVVKHPDFKTDLANEMYLNDIALVQLQENVTFSDTVKTVSLPRPHDHFYHDPECWVTGWGKINEKDLLGGKQTLQEVRLPLVDDVTCTSVYPQLNPQLHLCAGDMEGGKDSCLGDSGGPLVCVPSGEKRRSFVQVGIVSFGKGNKCGRKDMPAVYTRVSSYINFINKYINIA